jgi:hypothetical protein
MPAQPAIPYKKRGARHGRVRLANDSFRPKARLWVTNDRGTWLLNSAPFRVGALLALLDGAQLGCGKASSPSPSPAVGGENHSSAKPAGALRAIPGVSTDNRSALIAGRDPGALTVVASSSYPGWGPQKAIDGDLRTSWYSARDDAAALGKSPFLQIAFRDPVTVRHVTILGNRDPSYLEGYTILSGKLELFDASEHVLISSESAGTGNQRDFDFRLAVPIENVKTVRFTALEDQGKQNAYGDVAIAEVQVE